MSLAPHAVEIGEVQVGCLCQKFLHRNKDPSVSEGGVRNGFALFRPRFDARHEEKSVYPTVDGRPGISAVVFRVGLHYSIKFLEYFSEVLRFPVSVQPATAGAFLSSICDGELM